MGIITKNLKKGLFKALMVLMASCMLLTGCGQNVEELIDNVEPGNKENVSENMDPENTSSGLESGLKFSENSAPKKENFCGFKSDEKIFTIDSATLTFFYGINLQFTVEHELNTGHNYPEFNVYFENDEGDTVLVKHVEENIVSEKYRVTVLYDSKRRIIEAKYNYSEELTIPKELFTKESGYVRFRVKGIHARYVSHGERSILGTNVYYKIVDNKVELSAQKFE